VWLPFDVERLEAPPPELRYDVFLPEEGITPTESAPEVEFYVPSYRFSKATVEVIDAMTSLRVVQTLTAGVEHIRGHVPEGVQLCNGRGIHDASTAELAMAQRRRERLDVEEFLEQHRARRLRREPVTAGAPRD
jgi:phosphoglycerate dehydrogenase-like enzyme